MSHRRSLLFKRKREVVPVEDIISYWDFNSNSNDQIGSNNGVATSISYVSGLINNSASFAGNPSHIEVADSDSLSFTNGSNDLPFSFSLWFNLDTQSHLQGFFSKRRELGGNEEYGFRYLSGNFRFTLFGASGLGDYLFLNHPYSITNGQWYNVILTYDGAEDASGLNIYVNGVLQSNTVTNSSYTGMANGDSPFLIGLQKVADTVFYEGYMDEFYVFNKELNSSEVSLIYNAGLSGQTLI